MQMLSHLLWVSMRSNANLISPSSRIRAAQQTILLHWSRADAEGIMKEILGFTKDDVVSTDLVADCNRRGMLMFVPRWKFLTLASTKVFEISLYNQTLDHSIEIM